MLRTIATKVALQARHETLEQTMHRLLHNPITGESRSMPTGFSWVLFLFTAFYGIPLFVKGLIWHGLAVAFVALLSIPALDTAALPVVGALLLAAMVFYGIKGNDLAIARLQSKGWRVQGAGAAPDGRSQAYDPTLATTVAAVAGDTSEEKVCPQCAETVKGAAAVCRFCGHSFSTAQPQALEPPSTLKSMGAALMVGLLVIGALIAIAMIASETDTGSGGTALFRKSDEEVAAMPVTATELFAAYEANEQAAQLEYGGRPLEITGTISSIELDLNDEPMVSLDGDGFMGEVTLHFDARHASHTSQLTRGQRYTAVCRTLTEIMGAPQLTECTPGAARRRSAATRSVQSDFAKANSTEMTSRVAGNDQCMGSWIASNGASDMRLYVFVDAIDGPQIVVRTFGAEGYATSYRTTEEGIAFEDSDDGGTYALECDGELGEAWLLAPNGEYLLQFDYMPEGQIG